jgi:LysR family nitrogen assimilation transcriptional regulator
LDTRRLDAFIKVVDLGSVTRAASVLNVAQPALSQQMLSLEAEFNKKLLVRSTNGVTPTEAGQILYKYARTIQRQIEEARRSILDSNTKVFGNVTIGLAPWSSASIIAPSLLRETRRQYPDILLHIFDIFGFAFSEMMLKGRMDLAVLYGDSPPRGLTYSPFLDEEFYLVAPAAGTPPELARAPVSLADLSQTQLILPTSESFLRQLVERSCTAAGFRARIAAEIYSMRLLRAALADGIGATVLPLAPALSLAEDVDVVIRKLEPRVSMPLSICIPDSKALSDAAFAVHTLLRVQIHALTDVDGPFNGQRAAAG